MGKWAILFKLFLEVFGWWRETDNKKKRRHVEALDKLMKAEKTGDSQDVLDAFDDL